MQQISTRNHIEDSGKYASTSANDIVYGPEFGSLIDGMDAQTKNKLFGNNKFLNNTTKNMLVFIQALQN